METGKVDKNGNIIKLNDKIKVTDTSSSDGVYTVGYGEGSYDSGWYTYLGWYLTHDIHGDDGYGWILILDSKQLEIIKP